MSLIYKLYDERQRRVRQRKEIYKKIYSRIIDKIKEYNCLNVTECYYDIPPFILGNPNYSVKECIIYILWRIKKEGIRIQYVQPYRLILSWRLIMNKKRRLSSKPNLALPSIQNEDDNDYSSRNNDQQDQYNKYKKYNKYKQENKYSKISSKDPLKFEDQESESESESESENEEDDPFKRLESIRTLAQSLKAKGYGVKKTRKKK